MRTGKNFYPSSKFKNQKFPVHILTLESNEEGQKLLSLSKFKIQKFPVHFLTLEINEGQKFLSLLEI